MPALHLSEVPASLHSLPVCGVLANMLEALAAEKSCVLHAPPGAGKTTVVPFSLLSAAWLGEGKVVMLEPRRLAARHAAMRMASLINQKPGQSIGYRIRNERCESAETRILVVTEGVLTRMLQADQQLSGIGVVIFDEFHERSLHADTALALCLQAREILREDLRVLVMSATLATDTIAALLGAAPVVTSSGRQHPVETRYCERAATVPGSVGLLERDIVALAVQTIVRVLALETGSVLVFLPGVGEILRTAQKLREHIFHANSAIRREPDQLPTGAELQICPLYGELDQRQQLQAIAPALPGTRKVVLATNIAETSLTIQGVRVVVDSGLMRQVRFHPGTAINRLETVFISRDSADQRRGRAGRTEPGICYRLWSESQHQRLSLQRQAEITRSDLTRLMLELAQWGVADPAELHWLDLPPQAAVNQAVQVLQSFAALDDNLAITAHGCRLLSLAVEPRLAQMILRAGRHGEIGKACLLAAVLSESDLLGRDAGVDVELRLQALMSHSYKPRDRARLQRVQQTAAQLQRSSRLVLSEINRDAEQQVAELPLSAGVLLAFAYPQRIAMARGQLGAFLLASGRAARLAVGDPLTTARFIVVAELDDRQREARIYRAAELHEHDLQVFFGEQITQRECVEWDSSGLRVRGFMRRSLGAITLEQRALAVRNAISAHGVLLQGLREAGFSALALGLSGESFVARVNYLRHLQLQPELGPLIQPLALPDLSAEHLLATLEQWLLPYLTHEQSITEINALDLTAMLQSMVDYATLTQIDQLAPTHCTVPSGSQIAIDYAAQPGPLLAVRVQEVYGLSQSPTVLGGKAPLILHLLSPAQRPIAVTQDLKSFWRNGYQHARRELRGRYPKHYWPVDPATATATRKTKKYM